MLHNSLLVEIQSNDMNLNNRLDELFVKISISDFSTYTYKYIHIKKTVASFVFLFSDSDSTQNYSLEKVYFIITNTTSLFDHFGHETGVKPRTLS